MSSQPNFKHFSMTASQPFDARELRTALGGFVSGITVVTCTEQEANRPVGVTVSSFCSLSLDPPMILWCLARDARSTTAFLAADHFAVHVLAADQWHVAEKFATRGAEKFSIVDWEMSANVVPLIGHYAVRFECRRDAVHEGGDHLIMTGLIEAFTVNDVPPLAYHKGRYALTHRDDEAAHLMAWQSW
jgi:3-hydroxy-9,10-secoandrosta-1,3,5(10)-triene-9,17-dione monooxygenase reductase component